MTFKDLQKLIESQPDHNNPEQQSQLERLRGKAFWHWDRGEHKEKDKSSNGDCCFNHIIGLPRKDGVRKPLFDYEGMLYRALVRPGYFNSYPATKSMDIPSGNVLYPFKEKLLWILKATGLGVTEFMLRFVAWLCVRNDDCKNSQMVIVTGPNQELAIKLIKRMNGLFQDKLGITFDSKETVLELNGCSIEAYPSNHIDAFRSLTNPNFILIDEGDFMPKFQQDEVRSVSERYIAKSDPYIIMVSTPNTPGGLFQRIQQEPLETCLYKKIFLDYNYGLDKIYTKSEIEKVSNHHHFQESTSFNILALLTMSSLNYLSRTAKRYSILTRMLRNHLVLMPVSGVQTLL